MLKRKIIDRLEKWYLSGHYKAPLVFGARQVGKTTARHNLPPIVYGIIDIGKVLGNATFLRCFSKNNANPFQNRNIRSQALKGQHNLAQGLSPVCMTFPNYLPPLHAPTARGGEEERSINDRAHALSYGILQNF